MTQAVSATADAEVQTGQEHEKPEGGEHQPTGDEPNGEEAAAGGAEGAAGAEDDEDIVTLEGESPTPEEDESRAPEWVRELRKNNRELVRRQRELEQENARLRGSGQQPVAIVVGPKPTLEGCNYDAAKFETDYEAWQQRASAAKAQEQEANAAQQRVQQEWNAKLEAYGKERTELSARVRNFNDAEEAVKASLSIVQQGVLLNLNRPGAFVAAVGSNPAKLKELAAIKDPVKFAIAVGKLEEKVQVKPKKTVPPPEKAVRSSVAGAAAVDNTLEKLREEAARTGDMSKVVAYNRQKRAARG